MKRRDFISTMIAAETAITQADETSAQADQEFQLNIHNVILIEG